MEDNSNNLMTSDDESESEIFDELIWLKEIGFDENGDLNDEKNFLNTMSKLKTLNSKHRETITRRLISFKKQRQIKQTQRADVRKLFENQPMSKKQDEKQPLDCFLSLKNLDNFDLEKRNLSLPTIDKKYKRNDNKKLKAVSDLNLDEIKKDNDYLKKRVEINKLLHLDWSTKMKFWCNLKDQLPIRSHNSYLVNRKNLYEIKPVPMRKSNWWFSDNRQNNDQVEIISLKKISTENQNTNFVNENSVKIYFDDLNQNEINNSSKKNISSLHHIKNKSDCDFNNNKFFLSEINSLNCDKCNQKMDNYFQLIEIQEEGSDLKNVNIDKGLKNIDYLDHLTSNHQIKLKRILMLELTSLLDTHGIRCEKLINKRKSYKKIIQKNKKNPFKDLLFGVSLDELLKRDQNRLDWVQKVPIILKIIIDYIRLHGLQKEGILRVAASERKKETLCDELRKLYCSCPNRIEILRAFLFQLLNQFTIYDVIAVFKQLIRELPEPLLDFSLQDIFLIVPKITNYKHKLQILNILILLLNTASRSTLKEILLLLKDISKYSDFNKMPLSNIATVIAPNLFLTQLTNEKHYKQIERTLNSCEVTKLIIFYCDFLFKIPPYISHQIEHLVDSQFD